MNSAATRMRSLLAGLLVMLCAAPALPQASSLYTVEIVVFRNAGTGGALPATEVLPVYLEDGIEATPAPTAKLRSAAQKLAGSAEFKVLGHVAWTQGPTVFGSRIGVSTAQLGLGNGIGGKIGLEKGTNLNLRLDLTLEDAGQRYRLNETRSLKPNEINYFDHPAVGVIAIVTAAAGG